MLGHIFGTPISVVLSNNAELLVVVTTASGTVPLERSAALVIAAGTGCIGGSFLLPAKSVPSRYFLRALAVVFILPALGFLGGGVREAFYLQAHLAQVFKLGYWFLVVSPAFFAVTGFLLPGNMVSKCAVVLCATGYLYLTVPLLALLHLHLILLMGPAIAPALNTFLSILVLSIAFIAFYGVLASTPVLPHDTDPHRPNPL